MAEPGHPPFDFDVRFDPASIRPERNYSIRAQVSVGRRLIFVSDTMNPVLTQGASDAVDVWMIKVGDTEEEARDAPAAIGAHGLRLPASFIGDLPCAACERLRYRLNLWPDQVFHLRRDLGRQGGPPRLDRAVVGRPGPAVLTLRGAGDG